jgi:hypothetical protein
MSLQAPKRFCHSTRPVVIEVPSWQQAQAFNAAVVIGEPILDLVELHAPLNFLRHEAGQITKRRGLDEDLIPQAVKAADDADMRRAPGREFNAPTDEAATIEKQ